MCKIYEREGELFYPDDADRLTFARGGRRGDLTENVKVSHDDIVSGKSATFAVAANSKVAECIRLFITKTARSGLTDDYLSENYRTLSCCGL